MYESVLVLIPEFTQLYLENADLSWNCKHFSQPLMSEHLCPTFSLEIPQTGCILDNFKAYFVLQKRAQDISFLVYGRCIGNMKDTTAHRFSKCWKHLCNLLMLHHIMTAFNNINKQLLNYKLLLASNVAMGSNINVIYCIYFRTIPNKTERANLMF